MNRYVPKRQDHQTFGLRKVKGWDMEINQSLVEFSVISKSNKKLD